MVWGFSEIYNQLLGIEGGGNEVIALAPCHGSGHLLMVGRPTRCSLRSIQYNGGVICIFEELHRDVVAGESVCEA